MQVVGSKSIDYLRAGDKDGARCERVEVRIELGALSHARVEAPGVYAVRGNLRGLDIARSACHMQLVVSLVRI